MLILFMLFQCGWSGAATQCINLGITLLWVKVKELEVHGPIGVITMCALGML